MDRRIYALNALDGYPTEIGMWLWALQDVRSRTLRFTAGLDQRTLDWEGPREDENAIGSLLYHIAVVEMGWMYMDIREGRTPDAVKAMFPYDDRDKGRLMRVRGLPLADHLKRLEDSRRILLTELSGMTLEDWRTLRNPPDEEYAVSPAWVIYHLVEHEAGHAAQIGALKARAGRFFGAA